MLWFRAPEKVYIKKGCLPVALQELKDVMNKKRVFIVTDSFLFKSGFTKIITDKLDEKLDYLVNHLKVKKFVMYLHPYVDAYIKKGMFSLYGKWRRRYGRGMKIVADESLAYLQYKVVDDDGKEIDLKEESDISSSQSKSHSRVKNRDNAE